MRLELLEFISVLVSLLFQFHKGAIRTLQHSKAEIDFWRFQFHKGAIRTRCQCRRRNMLPYFNSIKVRLERCFITLPCLLFRLFQFHKGAIRTQFQKEVLAPLRNFNSIKVRLEHSTPISFTWAIVPFQFHKGAIRTSRSINTRA